MSFKQFDKAASAYDGRQSSLVDIFRQSEDGSRELVATVKLFPGDKISIIGANDKQGERQ